jgi:hypothetical protein
MPVPDSHSRRPDHACKQPGRGEDESHRASKRPQFVFSRQKPPLQFIKEHFGKPAPKSIGIRMRNGEVETRFDRSRDR